MDFAERLHHALRTGRRFSVIRSIVEAHPEAVTTRVGLGLAIHTACHYRASMRIIQYLFRKDPESLTARDIFGLLPLHIACSSANETNGAIDLATVRFLVEEVPETVMATDNLRCLPIHFACEREDSTETVKFLIESNPQCVRCKDLNSLLPLHHACEHGAPFEMVQLLVDNYPQAIQAPDAAGNLPLHSVCDSESGDFSLEIVRYLVEQFPQGVSQRDRYGLFPVHCACIKRSNQPELVQFLIDAFPESMVDEANGNHLLHVCCWGGYFTAHPNLVRYFVQQCPEAVKMRNSEGNLPLHICADDSSPNLEKLMTLIEAYHTALVTENADGETPLELHLDAIGQASDDEDGNEDQAHNARQIMEDALRRCIQEMQESFEEATLCFNLPDVVVKLVFAFAVPHVAPEDNEAE